MVLTTSIKNACHRHTLRKKCICTRACTHMQRFTRFFAMEAIANLSWVLHEHCAGCHSTPALLPARQSQSPDAVRSRNSSKSTLAHDAVAAAVSHKHHLIIRVGAPRRASFSLYMVHTRAWPRTSPLTKIGEFSSKEAQGVSLSNPLGLCRWARPSPYWFNNKATH